MFNTSKNPQVIYSLKQMSDSLFALLEKERFEEITISEITNYAVLTRKTFYRNCESKMDLVDYAIAMKIFDLLNSIDINSQDGELLFRCFFEYWKKQQHFLTILLKSGLFHRFNTVFTEYGIKGYTYNYLENILSHKAYPDIIRKYNSAYISNGLVGVLYAWTLSDFSDDIEQLVYVMKAISPEK